ncbi:MAG: hypothetical protein KGJ35_02135 [Patescibacteria group bacterium]|nr:hypothetical protein [Patescibacteria group bacterium]
MRFIEFREQGPEESEYWPGLPHHRQEERFKVIYTREIFRVFIKPCLYHDEYVLSEHDKTTVFRWVPIEPDFIEQ